MGSEKRARQKENRQLRLARQEKAATQAKWRRRLIRWPILLGLMALAFWLPTLGDDETDVSATSTPATVTTATAVTDDSTVTPPQTPGSYDEFRLQTTACDNTAPDETVEMIFDEPEQLGLEGTVEVTLATSCGDIALSLDADSAPETVNNFVFLAQQGYFGGTVCHRLVPGFVLQCGDQTGTGTGSPGYVVPDEFPEAGFDYSDGVLAMANSGAGTTGSQFFLVIGDTGLSAEFSVFGTFEDPDGAIAAMLEIPLGPNSGGEQSVPLETVYLNSVTVNQ